MTDPERLQLVALRAQAAAIVAQVDALLGAPAEIADGVPRCPKCGNEEVERVSTFSGPTQYSCKCGAVFEEVAP